MVNEAWDFGKKLSDTISEMTLSSEMGDEEHEELETGSAVVITGVTDYEKLQNLPTVNGAAIMGAYTLGEGISILDKVISLSDSIVRRVRMATTAQWAVEPSYVPDEGQIIIYSDYMTVGSTAYCGMKVGDGKTQIARLPFLCGEISNDLESHMSNSDIHVSAEDRAYWNGKNKVSESVVDEVLCITL